jgi:curved DNA-binding protein CbpA
MTKQAARDAQPASPYEVLQISPRASAEVIHAAYRALARSYHPDTGDVPQAVSQMRELNAAYAVLRDPQRRAAYDAEAALNAGDRVRRRSLQREQRRTDERRGQPTVREARRPSLLGRAFVAAVIVGLIIVLLLGLWTLVDVLADAPLPDYPSSISTLNGAPPFSGPPGSIQPILNRP